LDVNHPGDYTTCCIQDSFAPDSRFYGFNPPKGAKAASKTLHLVKDAAQIAALESKGWRRSQHPKSKSTSRRNESELRSTDLKWDTMIRRSWTVQKNAGIFNPSIVLHAMHRREKLEQVEYAAAVTVRAKKYSGDLYSEMRSRFPVLTPVVIRTRSEIRIPI
jgi:hypothetical protein